MQHDQQSSVHHEEQEHFEDLEADFLPDQTYTSHGLTPDRPMRQGKNFLSLICYRGLINKNKGWGIWKFIPSEETIR